MKKRGKRWMAAVLSAAMMMAMMIPTALAYDEDGCRDVLKISVSYDDFTTSQTVSFTPSAFGSGFMKETITLDESQAYASFRIDEMTVASQSFNSETGQFENKEERITDFSKVAISFQTEMGTYDVRHSGSTVKIPMALLNQPRDEYDSMSFQIGSTVAILHFSGSGQNVQMDYAPFAGTYVCADSGKWFAIDNQGAFTMPGTTQSQNPIEQTNIVLNENGTIGASQVMVYTYSANLYFDWDSTNKTLTFDKTGGSGQTAPAGVSAGDVFERASLQMKQKTLSLQPGQSAAMEITARPAGAAVAYRSEDETIATVDQTGRVTAVNAGQTAVIATLGDLTARCTVDVTAKTQEQQAIETLNNGQDTKITTSQADKASQQVLQAAKDNGATVTYEVKDENGQLQYSWTFDGRTLTAAADVALEIEMKKTSGAERLDQALDGNALVLAFAHEGPLPGPAVVTVDVSGYGFADGQRVTLYHYDPDTGRLENLQTLTVQDGKVQMTITHCSTYVLSLRDDLQAAGATTSPQTGDDAQNGWIAMLALAVCALTAVCWRKRKSVER